jgi:hypothetical protein
MSSSSSSSPVLQISLALSSALCALLLAMFYATPGLGYSVRKGTMRCFCVIVARTEPHFGFLLSITSGLLLLSLFLHGCKEEETARTVLFPSLTLFISLTGLLSFDLPTHAEIHCTFVLVFFISALVLCIDTLVQWDDQWRSAGAVAFTCAIGVYFLNLLVDCTLFCECEHGTAVDVTNHLQLICIAALVFMLGAYVYSA